MRVWRSIRSIFLATADLEGSTCSAPRHAFEHEVFWINISDSIISAGFHGVFRSFESFWAFSRFQREGLQVRLKKISCLCSEAGGRLRPRLTELVFAALYKALIWT